MHPKKVTDVFNWLQEAYNPKLEKYRRLLVLSGPSGAAKTTTLRVLADELDVEILEYRNGSNLTFAVDDSELVPWFYEASRPLIRRTQAASP